MQRFKLVGYAQKNIRGSALVGTLVMVGILSMAVGVMLSSSNRTIRGSRDKILYEEAYQAALSGTHVLRAWMINPELAGSWRGEGTVQADLEALVTKARAMNEKIISDKYSPESSLYGTGRFASAGIDVSGEALADGRVVIYDLGNDNPIVSFINDSDDKKFDDNLFTGTPDKGHRNYVKSVRITTPGTSDDTSCSLRQTTLIVESTGVAEYAGTIKERTVHQRILIYPNKPDDPLLSAGDAIITRGDLAIQGKSHANIHWAPVLAKGDIALEFLTQLQPPAIPGADWILNSANGYGSKYNGAGVLTSNQHHSFSAGAPVEKWLKWMAGTGGELTASNGENLFAKVTDSAGTPIPITDFFADLYDGGIAGAETLSMNSITLTGEYLTALTSLKDESYYNGMLGLNDEGVLEGALVQGSDAVDARVDGFFNTMRYEDLKEYAKRHDGYYTFDGTNLKNAAGVPVKNNVLPNMKPQVEKLVGTQGYYDPLTDTGINDRILFIDGPNQPGDTADTEPNPEFSGKVTMPNFWKGVVYVNGGVNITGTKAQNMTIRTPDQFEAFRDETPVSPASHDIKGVFLDGILVANGSAVLGSNVTVYGTLAARDGVELGGTPSIFYNSANGEGRLKDDESENAEFRLIAGRLYEVAPSS